jgi:hypothetical protein
MLCPARQVPRGKLSVIGLEAVIALCFTLCIILGSVAAMGYK